MGGSKDGWMEDWEDIAQVKVELNGVVKWIVFEESPSLNALRQKAHELFQVSANTPLSAHYLSKEGSSIELRTDDELRELSVRNTVPTISLSLAITAASEATDTISEEDSTIEASWILSASALDDRVVADDVAETEANIPSSPQSRNKEPQPKNGQNAAPHGEAEEVSMPGAFSNIHIEGYIFHLNLDLVGGAVLLGIVVAWIFSG